MKDLLNHARQLLFGLSAKRSSYKKMNKALAESGVLVTYLTLDGFKRKMLLKGSELPKGVNLFTMSSWKRTRRRPKRAVIQHTFGLSLFKQAARVKQELLLITKHLRR